MTISLTLTCAGYPRLMPLATGLVQAEGVDLRLELSSNGSWAGRATMLQRALSDPAVQGGEQSMAGHLLRIDRGDRTHVGLPVFPLRNFTVRDLYVRKDGPIRTAGDLAGRRVGMYGWANSGSVWYRHCLAFLGLDLAAIQWVVGPVDDPQPSSPPGDLPPQVRTPLVGVSLAEMLLRGDLDAIVSPPRPRRFHPTDGPIVRLRPDFSWVEKTYFRHTGVFPAQHLILLRRDVWEAAPFLAQAVTDAFVANNQAFAAMQSGFPYGTPWEEAALEETAEALGADPYGDGFEANRSQVDIFCRTAFEAGLTSRLVTSEEYFAEYLKGR